MRFKTRLCKSGQNEGGLVLEMLVNLNTTEIGTETFKYFL